MMFGTLATIEWLKTRRRTAFHAGVLGFAGVLLLAASAGYYFRVTERAQPMTGPEWTVIYSTAAQFAMLIMLVTIVLLTSSERTWRTERQNVIDGLSRTQYFFGKLILVAGCALLLWSITLVIGVIFEVMNRGLLDAPTFPFMRGVDAAFLGGILAYMLFVGCMALLFGVITSSSGSGLALGFLFLMMQPLFMLLMLRQGGVWHEMTAYLPMSILESLSTLQSYMPELVASRAEQARAQGGPLHLGAGAAALLALVYSALFAAGAWLSIRRRDL